MACNVVQRILSCISPQTFFKKLNVAVADGLQEVIRIRILAKDLFDFNTHVFVLRIGLELTNESTRSTLSLSGKLEVGIVVVLFLLEEAPCYGSTSRSALCLTFSP